ncbi:hypothetical protein Ddc_08993 [Ditylenchus destructor]|nr:hypothetical protein Ddc_08993 [Ditylenchus destructor]
MKLNPLSICPTAQCGHHSASSFAMAEIMEGHYWKASIHCRRSAVNELSHLLSQRNSNWSILAPYTQIHVAKCIGCVGDQSIMVGWENPDTTSIVDLADTTRAVRAMAIPPP